jgi:hypothetical protein
VSFWEQNRKLCYGLLIALVLLLVLWPSFREGRPAVISFYKSRYRKLETDEKTNAKDIRKYYDQSNQRMSSVISQAKRFNMGLTQQYRELRNCAVFIPPMPFRIASWEPLKGLKFLEIQTKTHTVDLQRYMSLRDVYIGDQFFGLDLGGVPPEESRLPLLLRQLAMIDDLVRKATDCGVRRIDRVIPMAPMETGPLNRANFLKVYPVRMEIGGSFESVMKFVNCLDGYHGRVIGLGTESRREGDSVFSETIVEVDVGTGDGLTAESPATFSIFDETFDEEDGLRYKGRARVQTHKVLKDRCFAVLRKDELPPVPDGKQEHYKRLEEDTSVSANDCLELLELEELKVAKGDLATTNFYTLLDLKIMAIPPKEKNSLTNDIVATVTAGAVGLLEDTRAGAAISSPRRTSKAVRPPRILRGGY